MELWQWLVGTFLGAAAILTPVILASIARDRTLVAMIDQAKDAARKAVEDRAKEVDGRITRIRDEYVRRDDLAAHLQRIDKQFDGMREELRESSANMKEELRAQAEQNRGDFRELKQMINSLFPATARMRYDPSQDP